MRLRFFAVPAWDPGEVEEEVNSFLAGHRVLTVERELVSTGASPFWALCIAYLEATGGLTPGRRGKIDYREVLSAEQFALFARLRKLRKELAEREGVPPYALFTNEQLAAMVQQGARALEDLRAIPGVGPARVEKYGAAFLYILRAGAETEVQAPESENG